MIARALVAICCTLFALASTVRAEPKPKTDDRALAASHFKQGQLYFKGGDWDRAIAEYAAAYQLSPEPLLLFNIALCDDRAERPEKALAGYQHYLELTPEGPVADEAREDVVRLTPIVEKLRAGAAAAEAQRLEAEQRAAEAKQLEEQRQASSAAARAEHERRVARGDRIADRARLERWGAIAAAGVGVIALGFGIHESLVARDDGNAITSHTGAWTNAVLAQQGDGASAQTRMVVFTATGGVFVLGGAALYWLGSRDQRRAEQLRVDVQAAPNGGSVSLAGRF